jgi:hypothetical protein
VDAEGRRKGELGPGQWKNISTDRIILVPGPPHEIATVNRIFRMFADEGMTLNDIARWLNREGILNALGRPWLYSTVCDMLSNEKYIGNNVFNRSSVALKSKWKRNPPNRWIRAAGAFEPIVPRDLFMRARRRLAENFPYTSNELLDTLTAVWCRYGTISVDVLEACPVAPAVNTYRRCFGGLMNAYVKIGFVKPRVASWTKNQRFRAAMNNQIVEGVCTLGGEARLSPGGYVLRINDELTLSTSVVRLVTTDHNDKRWRFGYKTHRRPDILIVARLAEGQEVVRDYFCLPYLLIGRNWLTFSDGTTSNLEPFQANSLSPILQMFARVPVRPEASFRLRFLEDFETDAVAAMKREAWPSAGVQEIIAAIIRRIRILLADLEFVELLNSRGIKTMPCVLAPARESVQTNEYGPSLLEFAAVWGFVSRIMANADFAAHVTRTWPGFATEMRMAYLAILTEGPLARLPTALAFGQMPVAPSHSPLR